jgi:hypothetical protein
MASGHDGHEGCSCLTDQGTRYAIEQNRCRLIATDGQYEPFLDSNRGNLHRMDEVNQRARLDTPRGGCRGSPHTEALSSGATLSAPQVSGYGDIGARLIEPAS